MDTLVSQRGNGTVAIKQYYDDSVADSIRKMEQVLIKCHGSVTSPRQLIFTRTDCAKARNQHSSFYELLDALLRTHTFVFIGCGLNDPDIRLLLENYCFRHPEAPSHYFVMRARTYSTIVKEVYEESLRIKIIEYKHSKDHSYLAAELSSLVGLVESARLSMGTSAVW